MKKVNKVAVLWDSMTTKEKVVVVASGAGIVVGVAALGVFTGRKLFPKTKIITVEKPFLEEGVSARIQLDPKAFKMPVDQVLNSLDGIIRDTLLDPDATSVERTMPVSAPISMISF